MIALVVYLGSTMELDYPLPAHDAKLAILTAAGLIAVVPGVLTIWRVQRLASALAVHVGQRSWKRKLAEAVGGSDAETHPVEALQRLRQVLDNALFMLGLMLGAAVLSVAAFRYAVVASYPPVPEGEKQPFPAVYAVFYGGAFTILLTVLYARRCCVFERCVRKPSTYSSQSTATARTGKRN